VSCRPTVVCRLGRPATITGGVGQRTEWHTQFATDDPPDARRELTWRDRFASVGSSGPALYNYFSSSEDVLEEYNGNALLEEGGRYAWVKQEKFKGDRRSFLFFGGAGSDLAGWGFNLDEAAYTKSVWVSPPTTGAPPVRVMKAPDELVIDAAFLDGLKSRPFFTDKPAELFGANGSTWAAENKTLLLAKAFPARTVPVGANSLGKLAPEENLDMHAQFKTDNALDRWPRPDGRWLHSDLREVAYVHVYRLYNDFVSKGGLK